MNDDTVFIIEDEIAGTTTYKYKVKARNEKEALEKFKNDEAEYVDSSFNPETSVGIKIKAEIKKDES